MSLCIYPTPPPQVACDTRSTFEWSKTSLNSEFSFSIDCLTKAKEISLPYCVFIVGGMHFPRAFVQSEMQTALCRIRTLFDNNHYTKYVSSNKKIKKLEYVAVQK